MAETYTCAACLGTFRRAWTEEEALAEWMENVVEPGLYSEEELQNPAQICHDCYLELQPLVRETESSRAAERNA